MSLSVFTYDNGVPQFECASVKEVIAAIESLQRKWAGQQSCYLVIVSHTANGVKKEIYKQMVGDINDVLPKFQLNFDSLHAFEQTNAVDKL